MAWASPMVAGHAGGAAVIGAVRLETGHHVAVARVHELLVGVDVETRLRPDR